MSHLLAGAASSNRNIRVITNSVTGDHEDGQTASTDGNPLPVEENEQLEVAAPDDPPAIVPLLVILVRLNDLGPPDV